jgi:hypothetical protein
VHHTGCCVIRPFTLPANKQAVVWRACPFVARDHNLLLQAVVHQGLPIRYSSLHHTCIRLQTHQAPHVHQASHSSGSTRASGFTLIRVHTCIRLHTHQAPHVHQASHSSGSTRASGFTLIRPHTCIRLHTHLWAKECASCRRESSLSECWPSLPLALPSSLLRRIGMQAKAHQRCCSSQPGLLRAHRRRDGHSSHGYTQ